MDNGAERRFEILHVDDFDEFLDDFRGLFSPHFEITSAQSGADGLRLLDEKRFDAVIVDYDMLDMDGLTFLGHAKEKRPFLPVIFCTGQGSEDVARSAFAAGAADYFRKDFSLFVDRTRLVNSVRQAIDRRTMEHELARERCRLQSIVDLNPYAIQIYDREGHMAQYNRASLAMWKMTPPKEYVVWEDPVHLEMGYGPLWERVRGGGESMHFPMITYDASRVEPGHPDPVRNVAGVAFPLMDEYGHVESIVVMQEDVTARVQAEESLRQAHVALQESYDQVEARVRERTAELAEANQALRREMESRERLQAELIRKNRELEEFSSRVSHDLRNELLTLKSTLELASDTPELRKRSEGILERYDHLIEFVQRLLNLARSGRVISRRIDVPAEPLIRSLFERARTPQVEAELHLPPHLAPIPGDPLGLEQIFVNLLGNSFQYADPAKGHLRVDVEVHPRDDEVEVVYRDNGVGIPPESLERIFDISYTTDRRGHFGLGLSLVKKIVEAHGGQIRATSAGRGHGVEFTLVLPRRRKKAG